jgi:hypothetical protein
MKRNLMILWICSLLCVCVACDDTAEAPLTHVPMELIDDMLDSVYSLDPSKISDHQLEAFYIKPSISKPANTGRVIPNIPEEDLPANFNTHDFVFEGYTVDLSDEERLSSEIKMQKVNDYMDSLDAETRIAFENRIIQFDRAQRRNAALQKGEFFDEREEIAVYLLGDNQVWTRKAPNGHRPDLSDGQPFLGTDVLESDYDDETKLKNIRSNVVNLSLRSAYNGHNMTSYLHRVNGCISNASDAWSCYCSGTKISARMVITAGHCLHDNGNWLTKSNYWIPGVDGVNYNMTGGNASPNMVKGRSARIVHSNWYNYGWGNYDMGVFVLIGNQHSCDLGWFGYSYQNSLTGKKVFMYSVPGPLQSCADSPNPWGYCLGSIYNGSGIISTAGTHSFRYDVNSVHGMSGTGIYRYMDGDRYVIGNKIERVSSSISRACKINSAKRSMLNDIKSDYPDSSACN